MVQVRFEVDAKHLQRSLRGHRATLQRRTQREIAALAFNVEAGAKRRAPVAFGRLRTGIRVDFDANGLGATVGVFEGTKVNGQDINYAVYVHEGTKGKPRRYPPLGPLKLWAKRVLGDEGAAFAIAKKIYERGTEPQPFLRDAYLEARGGHLRRMKRIHRRLKD